MSNQGVESHVGNQIAEWDDAPSLSLRQRNQVLDFLQEGRSGQVGQKSGAAARFSRDLAGRKRAGVQAHYGLGSRISRSGVNVTSELRGSLCPRQYVS